MPPTTKTRRQYMMPCDGYVSSVRKWQTRPGAMTDTSSNMVVSPLDGSIIRRSGVNLFGDTSGAPAGIMESKWTAPVAREFLEIDSPSMTSGVPVQGLLYTKEDYTGSFDDGHFGEVWYRNTNDSTWATLGKGFTSTTYPTSGGSSLGTDPTFKCVPLRFDSGDGGYTRLGGESTDSAYNKFMRQMACPGSRKVLNIGNWMYAPNLHGTPLRWNKRNCKTSGEVERIAPWGLMPPLFIQTTTVPAAAAADGTQPFKDGDCFYVSVLFQFEDGSYSMPALPRPVNATLTGGQGFVQVGTPGGTNVFQNVAYSNIPIGPEGTIARILLRTPKQNRSATTVTLNVDPTDLRITGIIANNTQTTYTDTLADAGLTQDTNVVRFDHTWVRPSRYAFTLEQRVGVGYMRDQTAAIIMAPIGSAVDYDLNVTDTGPTGGWGNRCFLIQNDGTTISYGYVNNGGSAGDPTGQLNTITIGTKTIQDVVDTINATVLASAGLHWVAQVCPGSDPNTPASKLMKTVHTSSSSTSAASTTLTVDATTVAAIPLGAKIIDSAAKIAAGTYVVAKLSATTVQLSAAASGAGSAAALVFYCDTGDDAALNGAGHTAKGYGWLRSFAPSLPVVLHLKTSAQRTKSDKTLMMFTTASPGAAAVGTSTAANAFVVGNRRQPSFPCKMLQGAVDLQDKAIFYYDKGVCVFRNARAGGTGDDFDYRLIKLNQRRGTVAWNSICAGDGFAVDLTPVGLRVTDGSNERIISNDIWNQRLQLGSISAEIQKGLDSIQTDTDVSRFCARVLGTSINISYRLNTGSTFANRRQIYDYSEGADQSGLPAVLRPTGQTYGWSAPLSTNTSIMGEISLGDSNGMRYYGTNEDYVSFAPSTGYGYLYELDTGSTDTTEGTSGITFTSAAYTMMDLVDSMKLKSLSRIRMLLRNKTSGATGVSVVFNVNRDRTNTSSVTVTDTTAAAADFNRVTIEAPQSIRTAKAEVVEIRLVDDGTGNPASFYGVEADIDVLEGSYT